MRVPSFEQTVPYFFLSGEAINILPVITNGDYADDINYHYFQLLHPARPRRLWGQLPAEDPPPAAEHSLAEPSDCVTLCLSPSPSLAFFFFFLLPSQLLFQTQQALQPPREGQINEWGEIWDPWHRFVDFSLSYILSLPSPPFSPHYYISLLWISSLSQSCRSVSPRFLLSFTCDMKHPFLPHEIWRESSWIVYWLAACMPMAAGGQAGFLGWLQ